MRCTAFTRRQFIRLVGAGSTVAALAGVSPALPQKRKPNIVVLLADDLGYADLGCQGAKDLSTPNIDSMAASGVRFIAGYVSAPMCSPSRAGLMTGRYQQRFGHEFNPGPTGMDANFGLPVTEMTFPQRLQQAGYVTAHVGKWHLGKTPDRAPTKRGFTESLEAPGPEFREAENYADAAARFIDRCKDKPFFLYVAFGTPHAPLEPDPKRVERFAGIQDQTRRRFAAIMSQLDDVVGTVLESLRKNKLEDNTVIFFLSDNGAPNGSNGSLNTPFRGYKMQLYEGGIRVPFIMQWKGVVPAGKFYDNPVISLDIAATALAAAEVKTQPGELDGVNLMPFVKGRSGSPHETLYWRTGPRHAIRSGNWKLLRLEDGKPQLYDVAADPGEQHNLAAEKPEKVKELEDLFTAWNAQLAKPLWQERTGGGNQ